MLDGKVPPAVVEAPQLRIVLAGTPAALRIPADLLGGRPQRRVGVSPAITAGRRRHEAEAASGAVPLTPQRLVVPDRRTPEEIEQAMAARSGSTGSWRHCTGGFGHATNGLATTVPVEPGTGREPRPAVVPSC
jgi:hypothetical protein